MPRKNTARTIDVRYYEEDHNADAARRVILNIIHHIRLEQETFDEKITAPDSSRSDPSASLLKF